MKRNFIRWISLFLVLTILTTSGVIPEMAAPAPQAEAATVIKYNEESTAVPEIQYITYNSTSYAGPSYIILDVDGNLWGWGGNQSGVLGTGDERECPGLVRICAGRKFKQVQMASKATVALDQDGALWGWGDSKSGFLGDADGSYADAASVIYSPRILNPGTRYREISAYNESFCAVTLSGRLHYWGSTCHGNGTFQKIEDLGSCSKAVAYSNGCIWLSDSRLCGMTYLSGEGFFQGYFGGPVTDFAVGRKDGSGVTALAKTPEGYSWAGVTGYGDGLGDFYLNRADYITDETYNNCSYGMLYDSSGSYWTDSYGKPSGWTPEPAGVTVEKMIPTNYSRPVMLGDDGMLYFYRSVDPWSQKWEACSILVPFQGHKILLDDNYSGGGCTEAFYAGTVTLPSRSRNGYEFLGWSMDAAATVGASAMDITAPGTLYAVWKAKEYSINYILNGGTAAEGNPSTYSVETAAFTLNNPARAGYDFAGWTGSSGTTAQASVTIPKGSMGDKTYTANWTARTDTAYKVKHYLMDLNGKNYTLKDTEDKTGTSDAEITLSDLKKDYTGFTYKEGNVDSSVVTKTAIAADGSREILLHYKRNQHTVSLAKGAGVDSVSGSGTYYYGAEVTVKAEMAAGYRFQNWTGSAASSSAEYTFTLGDSDVSCTANASVITYTVGYTLNGGTVAEGNPSTYNVETATFMLNNPTRTGYDFAGWTGSNGTTKQTIVSIAKGSTGNKTYTANWTARTDTAYKVKHYLMDLDGRNYTLKETENKTGTSDAELTLSVLKKNYTGFTYKEGNVGSSVVTKTTIAADGSREISLYYTRNQYQFTLGALSHVKAEGTSAAGTYFFGAAITLEAQPDEGYEWVTWEGTGESDKTEKDTGFSMPTSHVTMTPKVVAKNYSIAYALGGGTNAAGNPSSYTVESSDIILADPARTGYDFTGWTGSNGTAAQKNVTIPKGTTGNKNYTANWKVITYTISYLMNKGTNSSANPAEYTVESPDITLAEPVRAGYDFAGWTGSSGTTPQKSVEIPKGSTGSKTYTANWTARTDTPYQIVIHRETLNGDYADTSTDITVRKKGTTDTKIVAAAAASAYQYEGFTYSHAKAQDSAAGGAGAAEINIDGEGDAVLHLYYRRNAYELTIGDYDESRVTTDNIDTTLLYGEKIKLRATALSGYKFSRWDSSDTGIQPDVKTSSATLTMAASDLTMTPLAADTVYTIDFKANDTDSHTPENNVRAVSVPEDQEYGYSETVTMPGCTRTGFTFLGWSKTKDGAVQYTAGQRVSGLSSTDKDTVALYAQWEERQYRIAFSDNDDASTAHNPSGNVLAAGETPSTAFYYYTDNITLPGCGFTRKGFTFKGWSAIEGSNAVEYRPGDFVHNLGAAENGTVTLYAAWAEKSYPVAFEPGDSCCYGSEEGIDVKVSDREAMDTARVYYTDGFAMPSCRYIRKGFTFLGWSEDKHASKKTYTDSTYRGELQPGDAVPDLDAAESHVYYPVWRENSYNVIYHANDGGECAATGSMASRTVYYTEPFCLAKNGFQRTGFVFRGWSAAEGSREVSYAKEEKVCRLAASGDVNLYAAWKEISYRVSFAPNDSYCYGAEEGITAKVSNPDAMEDMILGFTETARFPECGYLRKGFTFLGWSADKSDSLKTYDADVTAIQPGTPLQGLSSTAGEELVYYPVWKENRYSIAFDPNDEGNAAEPDNAPGADGVVQPRENVYYTQEVTLPRNQFTRTGFDYKGWSAAKGSNTPAYQDMEAVWKLSGRDGDRVTMYAAWREHSYTVNFRPADGFCYASGEGVDARVTDRDAMQPVVLKYTENWDIAAAYQRTGFTFLGYSRTDDNKVVYGGRYEAPFAAGDTLAKLSSQDREEVTLFAIWKENTYQISFHANDSEENAHGSANVTAEGSMEDITKVYYTEERTLPENTYQRNGFTFLGWAAEEGSREIVYKDGETICKETSTDNAVLGLYAVWSEHSYQILFDPNDGYSCGTAEKATNPASMAGITASHTDRVTLPENLYERKGFVFRGWTLDKKDVKKLYPENPAYDRNYQAPYQPGDAVSGLEGADGDTVTFYPVWEEISYRVNFHANDSRNAHTPENAPEAEGSMEDITKVYYTEEFTLPENAYTRTGFTWKGWGVTEKSNDVVYTDRQKLSRMTEKTGVEIDLYAAWKEHKYQITFVPNDGRCYGSGDGIDAKVSNPDAIPPATLYYTEDFKLPECGYRRRGFTFLGYSLANGTELLYLPAGREKTSLEEKAEEMAGRIGETPEDIREESAAPLSAGDVISRISAEENETVMIYPVWKEHQYNLHFHANDAEENAHGSANVTAEGSMEALEGVYYTEGITLPVNGFSREGFRYKGWSMEEHKNDVVYGDQMEVRGLTAEEGKTIDLYAAWKEYSFQICFDPNDRYCYGTEDGVAAETDNAGAMESRETGLYYTDAFLLPECSYEREGFAFLGWTFDADDVRKLYPENPEHDGSYTAPMQPGDTIANITTESSITVYPVWKEAAYGIHFHADDAGNGTEAEGSMEDIPKVYYTEECTLPENTYKKKGFTFLGWAEEGGRESVYEDRETICKETSTDNAVLNLYAVWSEHSYQILFDPNDGCSYGTEEKVTNPASMAGITASHTDRVMLPENLYERKGFVFLGWTLDKEDVKKLYPENPEYDRNYQAPYQPGDTVSGLEASDGGTVTFYPVWEEISYRVNFHANDSGNAHTPENAPEAEGSMEDIARVYYTEEVTLPENAYTRTGFTWKGWGVTEKGNAVVYTDGQKLSRITEKDGLEIDLYAAWQEARYTISYDANDGYCYGAKNGISAGVDREDAMEDSTVTLYYTEPYEIPSCGYQRDGFSFLGWTENSGDGKKLYPEDKEYDKDFRASWQPGGAVYGLSAEDGGDVILYPLWKEHKMTVRFDKNAGDAVWQADGSRKEVYYTEPWSVKEVPSRMGYQLVGYAEDKGAENADYQELTDQKMLAVKDADGEMKTLYALWDANKLSITYESEGIVSAYKETAVYGRSCTVADEKTTGFADPEKTFLGWSTETVEGYGTKADVDYEAGADSSQCFGLADTDAESSLHLYAVWRENTYNVSFDTAGGTGKAPATMGGIRYTEEIILPQNESVKEGCTFEGWSYQAGADQADFQAGEAVSRLPECNRDGAAVTLHAVWSVTPPEFTAQTETGDFGAEVKPGIPVTVSVSAVGLDLEYQWYRMEGTRGAAIEGADSRLYTIPAEDVTEENDGTAYRCTVTNEGGQEESRPFFLYVYGTPDAPAVTFSDMNERGWSSRDVRITLSGSTIKGSKRQVRYAFSIDGSTWKDCDGGMAWEKNTRPEGETVSFKAYNKDCPELESPAVTYTIRKDDEKPTITGIASLAVAGSTAEGDAVTGSAMVTEDAAVTGTAIVTEGAVIEYSTVVTGSTMTTGTSIAAIAAEEAGKLQENAAYPVAIHAADSFSGIYGYSVAGEGEEFPDWQESSRFELSAGRYRAYAMDMAGNAAYQDFTVYAGGYVLCSGSGGSYTEGGSSHVVGEGTASWDSPDMDRSKIESVVIEDGITEIPDGFFEGFTNLKDLTIPGSVIIIGEHAFDGVPEDMVIHAPEGSEGEKAAEKHHYTEYDITIHGTTGSAIHVHYKDSITLPETAPEKEGYVFIGWGTTPDRKEFEPGQTVSGLTGTPGGNVTLYPVYEKEKTETPEEPKDPEPPERPKDPENPNESEENSGTGNGGNGSGNYLPPAPETMPKPGREDGGDAYRQEDGGKTGTNADKTEQTGAENGENAGTKDEPEGQKGFYVSGEQEYSSLEDVFGSLEETNPSGSRDGEKTEIHAYGNSTLENNLDIPENIRLVVNETLVIDGDVTLSGGDMVILQGAEATINGSLTADTDSGIYIDGTLTVNGKLITGGCLLIGENGILHVAPDGTCMLLPEAALKNQGTIEGSIDQTEETEKDNGRITIKTKLPYIVMERGSTCVVKPVKGVTSWMVKNKKIASLKKKDGKLVLTGKKNGKTVLIGKKNGKTYRYVIRVKKKEYNHQIKLAVVGKEKSSQRTLTKSGTMEKEVAVKNADGKITLKLLWAGKDVKWKLSGNGSLKKKGKKAVITMSSGNCTVTAKYMGNTYRCELYR